MGFIGKSPPQFVSCGMFPIFVLTYSFWLMRIVRIIVLLAAVTLSVTAARAGVPVISPDLSTPTLVAPRWFGPNAFPVPAMSDGLVGAQPEAELAMDYFSGHLTGGRDRTWDAFLRLHLPLWSERAALTVWFPAVEYWSYDESVREARHILSPASGDPGHDSGDVYVSLDIQLLKETSRRPALLLRSVLKTASGNSFGYARYYDSPGYFFDLTAGKGFGHVRFAATTGFLCWQTDNGRQNDAVMYGLGAFYNGRTLSLSAQWGGYVGWERSGDAPMSVRGRAGFKFGRFEPYLSVQHGLRDWPFTQFRLGCVYRWGL